MAKASFERVEKKYLLNSWQQKKLLEQIGSYLQPDQYPFYSIQSIYFDTDQFDLIRQSIEKPVYKEKLRVRSYGVAGPGDPVFLELKKKFMGTVYKRRATMPLEQLKPFLRGEIAPQTQIERELAYFIAHNDVSEKALIYYDRLAFQGIEDSSLRLTLDTNLRFRTTDLRLDSNSRGQNLLEPKEYLMEIKVTNGFPVWLSRALSELEIFPTSFSKYGNCYKSYISNQIQWEGGFLSA